MDLNIYREPVQKIGEKTYIVYRMDNNFDINNPYFEVIKFKYLNDEIDISPIEYVCKISMVKPEYVNFEPEDTLILSKNLLNNMIEFFNDPWANFKNGWDWLVNGFINYYFKFNNINKNIDPNLPMPDYNLLETED